VGKCEGETKPFAASVELTSHLASPHEIRASDGFVEKLRVILAGLSRRARASRGDFSQRRNLQPKYI